MSHRKPVPVVMAIGYSVRALVEACWQAGVRCLAVDHFGDADTRHYADGRWVELRLTKQNLIVEEAIRALQVFTTETQRTGQEVVVVLAGGMENLGAAVEQLREIAVVLGPSEEQRMKLRSVEFLREMAVCGEFHFPETSRDGQLDGDCLWKPNASAGGLKIARVMDSGSCLDNVAGYWQRSIGGEQVGATCLVCDQGCELLGVTSGLSAEEWPGPTEFIYRGSLGPCPVESDLSGRLRLLASAIQTQTGYCGWLQFDFIRNEHGELYLLECNPRWTAGMEVLQKAGDENPIVELLRCYHFENSFKATQQRDSRAHFGKAVLYAERTVHLDERSLTRLHQIEGVADRPFEPQTIEAGHPIVTLQASIVREAPFGSDSGIRKRLLDKLWLLRRHTCAALSIAD